VTRKVGYLGPPGTFGEQAALLYSPQSEFVSLPSNGAVVAAVARGQVDEGIAPIENSLDGAISDTLDALIQHEGVMFRHELVLPVEQCLIVAPGTRLGDIAVVTSHPSALAQCREYIEVNLPAARLEAALSTAGAVAGAVRTPGAAAIGTARAAELNGGQILARAIQDVKLNKTRFLVVARSDADPTGDDKTSVAFTVAHDRPGTLMGVLSELSEREINLTRIESRPSRADLGIYIFLIDFQGHRRDPAVEAALAAVHARAHYFRLLGSYPRSVERASPAP
jgi:prephenate dehydratase